MRAVLIVLSGLGSALLVGGILAFVFGGWLLTGPLFVTGLGPFNGFWSSAEYCFLGAILASIGAGLLVSALLGLRSGPPR